MAESLVFTSERILNRNSNFLSTPDFQSKNQNFAVSLRKSKRLEISSKKRRVFTESVKDPVTKNDPVSNTGTFITREYLIDLSSTLLNTNLQFFTLQTLRTIYSLGYPCV